MATSAVRGAAAQLGGALFRFRSFTPVPIIAITAVLLWRSRGVAGPGGAGVDAALNAAGVGVALLGQALRFYTLGLVREGTSGQGAVLQATHLNTRGPYAHVRNPLYLGNLGICLGLLLVAHHLAAYALVLGFFFFEYFFIIRAEEAFLLRTHGEPYREFLARVPRWVPRLTPAYQGRLNDSFDVGRALKKEHNPFAAWASGVVLLWGWELWARGRLTAGVLALLVAVEAVVLVSFAIIKAYKRGWLFRV
jgi:protein-S-isoprenylcysteine O-methyltransferase Ste14